nr:MAG TPA: hypothetical protein [Caudoviricetes sp.]
MTLFSTFLLPFSVLFCCTLSHYLLKSGIQICKGELP